MNPAFMALLVTAAIFGFVAFLTWVVWRVER